MNKSFKRLSMRKYLKTCIMKVNNTSRIYKGHVLQCGDTCKVLVVDVIDEYTLRVSPN